MIQMLGQIRETKAKLLIRSPEIVTESEKFEVSYPEHQSVHQAVDARALKLCSPAVLHQFGVGTWWRSNGYTHLLARVSLCHSCMLKTNMHPHTHTHLQKWPGRSRPLCCGGRSLAAACSGCSGGISCLASTESRRNGPACCWAAHTPPRLDRQTHIHWTLYYIERMSESLALVTIKFCWDIFSQQNLSDSAAEKGQGHSPRHTKRSPRISVTKKQKQNFLIVDFFFFTSEIYTISVKCKDRSTNA